MRRAALICALAALPAAVGALRAPHSALTKAARSLDRAATLRGLAAAGLSAALGFVATPSSARAAVVLPDFVKNQMGANAERPFDVGGGGRRTGRSGYLNQCPSKRSGRTCISSFDDPYDSSYVPPWSYYPAEDTREGQEIATGKREPKTLEAAFEELRTALAATPGAKIIEAKDRYIVAEFTDPTFGTTDDVEFLFSLDSKGFVNYRSAARATGGDDKRHRERVKELRKALQVSGWRSLGRLPL